MCLPWLEDWQAFHFLVTFLKIKLGWVSASIYLKIFSCCILSFLLQTPIRSMFDIRLLYIFPAVIWALFIFLVFFSASVSVCIVSLLDFKLITFPLKYIMVYIDSWCFQKNLRLEIFFTWLSWSSICISFLLWWKSLLIIYFIPQYIH